MKRFLKNLTKVIVLFNVIFSLSFSLIALPASAQQNLAIDSSVESKQVNSRAVNTVRTVKILSENRSRSLKITPIPTNQPIPLIVGNYWDCRNQGGFELCDLVLVVCTDDQSLCVEN